jgi:hypothetical protein
MICENRQGRELDSFRIVCTLSSSIELLLEFQTVFVVYRASLCDLMRGSLLVQPIIG